MDSAKALEPIRFTKPFHFEEMWLFDRRCTETVEAVWSSVDYDGLAILIDHKIEKCSKALTSWN